MKNRIIDISEAGARLSLRNEQLVIRRDESPDATVPLEDLALLLVTHRAITLTQPLLARMSELGTVLVVCGGNHHPAGLLLPVAGHTLHTQRLRAQIAMTEPKRKRLWQSIVRAKIRAQGRTLRDLRGDDGGLIALASRVKSGDPANVEAHAARRYWPLIFKDPEFRRRAGADGANALLNYGYAVLRAAVARAVVSSGLHPALGLQHSNRENPFCLADDLMEPFRPLVDAIVAEIVGEFGTDAPLTRDTKPRLLAVLTTELDLGGERRGLFDCLTRLSSSLAEICESGKGELTLPEL